LDLGGDLEQRKVVQFGVGAYGHGAGGDDPGADGGRGGAESAAVRDAVGAHDLDAAGLPGEQGEGGAQGAYEQVPLVAREGLAALTGDVDVQSRVGHPDDHVVVEAQREAEGVEARADVGAGGGNAHPDGGSAEGGTGHRSMTLLELRVCRMTFDDERKSDGGTPPTGLAGRFPGRPGPRSGPWGRRCTAAYAAGGFSTAYRRKVLCRHRAHGRRTMRVVSPLCHPARNFPRWAPLYACVRARKPPGARAATARRGGGRRGRRRGRPDAGR